MPSRSADPALPGPLDGEAPAVRLLRLLANDGSTSDITAVGAPETERDLALRIRDSIDRRRRREAELSALVDTARDLASVSDPEGVLDAIVRRARTLLGTDIAYLTLFDPDQGDTYMRATDGSISAEFQSLRLSLGDGLGGLVASTRKSYWTADYTADQRFQHTGPIDSAVHSEGIVAICGTPLLVGDEFVGVLFAANRSPRPFSHDEVALLISLAALAAVTIVQVRALAETEQALVALSAAHETVRRHVAEVERAAAAHDRFAGLVLAGGRTDDITEAVAELLGGWVVLLDERGVRRGQAGPAPAAPADPEDRDPLAGDALCAAATSTGRLAERGDRYVVPVIAAHEPLGLLVIGGLPAGLTGADRRMAERAATVTALVLLFERQAMDAQQQARTDVVSDLVAGRGDRADRLAAVKAHGLDLSAPWCLLAVRGDGAVPPRALVLSTSMAVGPDGVVGSHDGLVIALAPGDDPGHLARTIAARLRRSGRVTVAGVGPVADVDDVRSAHEEAVRTVNALVALGHLGTGAAAADLGFAGLVVGSQPDIAAYVRGVLGPVEEYDAKRGTELVRTLEEYFAAGSSPRHAAGELHVHVNTVVQRVDRIGALLGPDWQSPERALELQLALRLRRLMARR